jgi:V/A-type H+-transporting ATPase subunit I
MIPLFLSSPESMLKVRVITVKDASEKTLKTLHRIGVLHIEESKELKPIDKAAIEHEQREVSELLSFVDNVLGYIPQKEQVSLEEDVEVIYTKPFKEIGDEVRLLYNKINKLHERIVKLGEEAKQLIELKRYLEPIARQTALTLRDLKFSGDYLFSKVFVLSSETYKALCDKLAGYLFENVVATVENETVFHAVAKVRDQMIIECLVTDAGGKIVQIPDEDLTLKGFLEIISSRIGSLEDEMTRLREELQSRAREDLNRITLLREALSAENERLSVLEKGAEAKYVTLIEGWIPENDTETAISEVRESIDYVFIDTRKPEQLEEPPSKLRNFRVTKPFQTIVNLFATPKYREWDPTPIISYSFAFFFGIMVGDVIYALGIILLSRFLLGKFVDDPQSDGFKLFQRLIYTCGSVALVVGLLSGTYLGNIYEFFGIKSLALVAGVQKTLQDPILFIMVALGIGFVHVNIGHLLALIRGVRERQKGVIINKIGLFLLQLGIPSILHSLLHVNIPLFTEQLYSVFMYVMGMGVIVVITGNIIQSGGLGVITGIFDLTGILGDIMSYARLAGVGLATLYLALAFNTLAELLSNMIPGIAGAIIGGILGIGILILGHMLNMVLSVITGFVHSLRLCFVEFLFKFYEGGGREYSPFILKKRISAPILTES